MPTFIDNAFLDIVLDTGGGGLLLTHDAAMKAGATDAALAKGTDPRGRGTGRRFPAVYYHFQQLLVGKDEFDNLNAQMQPDSNRTNYGDGLMDWRCLKPRRFWFSYATNTLFVQTEGK